MKSQNACFAWGESTWLKDKDGPAKELQTAVGYVCPHENEALMLGKLQPLQHPIWQCQKM